MRTRLPKRKRPPATSEQPIPKRTKRNSKQPDANIRGADVDLGYPREILGNGLLQSILESALQCVPYELIDLIAVFDMAEPTRLNMKIPKDQQKQLIEEHDKRTKHGADFVIKYFSHWFRENHAGEWLDLDRGTQFIEIDLLAGIIVVEYDHNIDGLAARFPLKDRSWVRSQKDEPRIFYRIISSEWDYPGQFSVAYMISSVDK